MMPANTEKRAFRVPSLPYAERTPVSSAEEFKPVSNRGILAPLERCPVPQGALIVEERTSKTVRWQDFVAEKEPQATKTIFDLAAEVRMGHRRIYAEGLRNKLRANPELAVLRRELAGRSM